MASDIGRIRKKNEDNFIFHGMYNEKAEKHIEHRKKTGLTEPILYGIFDGMGGEAYGEVASRLMAMVCQKYQLHPEYLQKDACALCQIGNEFVTREEELRGLSMGSTASMLIFYEKVLACNVGDSPIFLYRDGELRKIYEEQTEKKIYEQMQFTEILNKKKKYRLLRHIGMQGEEIRVSPYIEEIEVKDQDVFLICSDGLTDMVSEEAIGQVLSALDDDSAERLVNLALENGGYDNVTVILIKVSSI